MLVNLQVPWVILGHSERRALLSESNNVSSSKFRFIVELMLVGSSVVLAIYVAVLVLVVGSWKIHRCN